MVEWSYDPTHSLTSEPDGGERLASRPDRFTPRERARGINCTGGWVGRRDGTNTVEKEKIPCLFRESNLLVVQLLA
jgi:hypothetical protein